MVGLDVLDFRESHVGIARRQSSEPSFGGTTARARRTAVIEVPSRGIMDGFYAVDCGVVSVIGVLCYVCLWM